VTPTVIQFAEMLDSPRGEEEREFLNIMLGIQSAIANLHSEVRLVSNQVEEVAALQEQSHLWETFTPTPSTIFADIGRPRVSLASLRGGRLAASFRRARVDTTPLDAATKAAESEPPKPDAPSKEEK